MKTTGAVLWETCPPDMIGEALPLSIEELELGEPGWGQVLVENSAAGLCHSDLSGITGVRARKLPAVVGHEGTGTVVAIGPGVTRVAEGDTVVMMFVASCGFCGDCRNARPYLCRSSWSSRAEGTLTDGTRKFSARGREVNHWSGISAFSRNAVVSENSVVKIDSRIPSLDAAMFGCSVITGVGSVTNAAKVRPGDTVAVVGLGGVGLSAILGAVLAGAREIIAVDISEDKLQLAQDLGATTAFNATSTTLTDDVHDLTGGGVDHVLEMSGARPALKSAYSLIRRGGIMTAASLPESTVTLDLPYSAHVSDAKVVQGSYMGNSVPHTDIPKLADLYLEGRLPVDKLRSRTLRLDEINEGFTRLSLGTTVREVVDLTLPAHS